LDAIRRVTNNYKDSYPVNRNSLQLSKKISGYLQESNIVNNFRSKIRRKWYSFSLSFKGLFRRLALSKSARPFKIGERHINELLLNTDYQKFDEVLGMVIDVPPKTMEKILSILEQFRRENEIFYGTHRSTSTSTLMTWAVTDSHGDQIHFIDGNVGGYTLSSQQLKAQRSVIEKS
jgi:hypothetical protein